MDFDSYMFGLLSALAVVTIILATVTLVLQLRAKRNRRNVFPLWRLRTRRTL